MAFRRYRSPPISLTAERQQTRIQLRGSGGVSPPSRTSQVSFKSRCEQTACARGEGAVPECIPLWGHRLPRSFVTRHNNRPHQATVLVRLLHAFSASSSHPADPKWGGPLKSL